MGNRFRHKHKSQQMVLFFIPRVPPWPERRTPVFRCHCSGCSGWFSHPAKAGLESDETAPFLMAKRRRKSSRTSASRASSQAAEAPLRKSSSEGTTGDLQAGERRHWGNREWSILYGAVFGVVVLIILVVFTMLGGDSRPQRAMLDHAAELRAAGKHDEAVGVLLDFGKRWPGAYGTQNFERRLGDYYFDAGEYEEAADHYQNSVRADPEFRGTRALAGRALWMAGDHARAVPLFREELEKGDREDDIAQFYLGLNAIEEGNPVKAFDYFQAIEAKEDFAGRLAEVRQRIDEEYLEPARRLAEKQAEQLAEQEGYDGSNTDTEQETP